MTMARIIVAAAVSAFTLLALTLLACTVALAPAASSDASLSALPGQVADIPPEMLTLYANAGAKYGIDWAVLAAIGKIETNHNRSTARGVHSGVNFAGCCAGSMQFSVVGGSRSTWATYGVDGNADGKIDIYDPADAIPAAARYLKASGAPKDYRRAIFAYNHASWYVADVLRTAENYRSLTTSPPTGAAPWQLLANPRILLSPTQRADIARGRIDPRVVDLLALIAQSHTLTISALRSDHALLTREGRPSNHATGRAVDIASVDGEICTGTRDGSCGRLAIQLGTLTGPLHVTELIYCFDPDGNASPDGFALPDHCTHIHAGYRNNPPELH